MKSLNTFLINLFKDEFKNSESLGKWLLLIAVVNIPLADIFIPYFTQGLTIILLSIFLKKYISTFSENSKLVTGLCSVIILFQLFWLPYISQLITLTLIGILYGVFTKYS